MQTKSVRESITRRKAYASQHNPAKNATRMRGTTGSRDKLLRARNGKIIVLVNLSTVLAWHGKCHEFFMVAPSFHSVSASGRKQPFANDRIADIRHDA